MDVLWLSDLARADALVALGAATLAAAAVDHSYACQRHPYASQVTLSHFRLSCGRRPPSPVGTFSALTMSELPLRDGPFSSLVLVAAVCGLASGCTYAPAEPLVRVANHTARAGTDSVAIAVYAAEMRRPTGIAAFPDGGAALLQHEQGIFYLCVASPERPASIERIGLFRRPDSLRTGFMPWVSGWDSPASVIVSLRGYASAESRPEAHRILWYRLRLLDGVEPRAIGPGALEPATSLQAVCEAAVGADARAVLARTPSTPDAATNGRRAKDDTTSASRP